MSWGRDPPSTQRVRQHGRIYFGDLGKLAQAGRNTADSLHRCTHTPSSQRHRREGGQPAVLVWKSGKTGAYPPNPNLREM